MLSENETYSEIQEFFERENAHYERQSNVRREREQVQARRLYAIVMGPVTDVLDY